MFLGGTISLPIWEMTAHFIRNMGEEVQFYWKFEKGGTSLLDKLVMRLADIYIHVQNYSGCWLELRFMVQTLAGGLVV